MRRDRDTDRHVRFGRRALLLGVGQAALLGGLGARQYWLTMVEGGKYKVLADDNRIGMRLQAPSRGLIFDRTGEPLAANRNNYRVVMTAEKLRQAEEAMERLDKILGLGEVERKRLLGQFRRFTPITVKENLSWEQVAQIEFNGPELPGVAIELGQTRDYFHAELMSHIVGYIGRVDRRDLGEDDDPLLQLPGMRIGKKGIEKRYDDRLRGKAGAVQMEVNAVGRVVRELDRSDGEPGGNLLLTIDLELQRFVAERLKNESASAVVMDVISGDILAMVSVPGFDSNVFARGITQTEWNELLSHPMKPLFNKAVSGAYPPGSTYKMVTALAALEAGVIDVWTPLPCTGSIDLPGKDQKKYCWIHPAGHGWLNLHGALAQSCDSYFYEVAKRAGVERIADMAFRLGFGRPTGAGLPEESAALQPTRAWKQDTQSKAWNVGDTYNLGIGQGDMLATPLQMAVMTARIANGGYEVKPRLVASVARARDQLTAPPVQTVPDAPSLRLKPANLAAVRQGMVMAVNGEHGTAWSSRITQRDMAMAGKTGTSQVKRITESERGRRMSQTELPWHLRHHALFVAYAPIDNPRYACAVIVEHGMGGSTTAAPITKDILLQTQKLDPSRKPGRFKGAAVHGVPDTSVAERK
ncbi:MAG: penicillin-binding protein 2 [Alphaproteobacteria bacterium]|nr:penicillin-binding protein 2 [Alphaproteobacteria bacterium]MCW5742414.1 penicillin-binding protein 2 [Alphaproteobacteria bacterium]